ncbi:hypothetical protein JMJ35_003829 [Cladonia borealis]|uniref:Calcineurin-like phosphoesterase domain-containing protein n=1 Tax=Cladonia borealis TaxID=184061 RepID=A0AA39V367_9LECA|nr:hypothetical protein JMJ35_003829 [Cladonia borealis]
MSPPTIKTRILILSDTHTHPPFPSSPSSPSQPPLPYTSPLPPSDILIHSGDLTLSGRLPEYNSTYNWIAAHPATLKLVIPGNHDVSLDEGWGVWRGEEARGRGVVFLEEGVWRGEVGNGAGVRVYSSPYTPEYQDWAFPYPRHIDRFNPTPSSNTTLPATNPIPAHPAIDIIITHGPPKNILDKTYPSNSHVGCSHLLKAVSRCKPRLHCFGHIHEGWGAERMNWGTGEVRRVEVAQREKVVREKGAYVDLSERSGEGLRWGEETVFVNASIMDVGYKAVNAPWIVDLDLPVWGEIGKPEDDELGG